MINNNKRQTLKKSKKPDKLKNVCKLPVLTVKVGEINENECGYEK